ncbi:MAG: hypothetical protein ABIA78_01345 [archaeon]
MAKKKDKVRFGVVLLMFLFAGLLVAGTFYLSHFVEQNFQKPSPTTLAITKDELVFADVFFELYSFPGCSEVERGYLGNASLAFYLDYYNNYECEFFVDEKKVKLEDEHLIKDLNVFKEHKVEIECKDYMGNKVSKVKILDNYC